MTTCSRRGRAWCRSARDASPARARAKVALVKPVKLASSLIVALLALACGGRVVIDGSGTGAASGAAGSAAGGGSGVVSCPSNGSTIASNIGVAQINGQPCASAGESCQWGVCNSCTCSASGAQGALTWACGAGPCISALPPPPVPCPAETSALSLESIDGLPCAFGQPQCGPGGCEMSCSCFQPDGDWPRWACSAGLCK